MTIDVDSLVAIDVHVHAERVETGHRTL